MAFGEKKSLGAQQLGSGRLAVHVWLAKPEEYIKIFNGKTEDPPFVKNSLLKEFEHWNLQLLKLIEMADGAIVPRNLYMLPVVHKWVHRDGITLLGDAAHLMAPFSGEGVNLAMCDSMKLARAIQNAALAVSSGSIESQSSSRQVLGREIEKFEKEMFARATKFQQITWKTTRIIFFESGGMEKNIEKFVISLVEDGIHRVLLPVFYAAVYVYFWVWRRWNGVDVGKG